MTPLLSPDDVRVSDAFPFHALPPVSRQLAMLQRAAFCGRSVIEFMFGGTAFDLRFVPQRTGFSARLGLQLRIGKEQGWLLLESFDIAGPEWSGILHKLEPALIRVLLIEETTRQCEQLARLCGEAVQLMDLQIDPLFDADAPTQALRIENRASGIGVRAALRAETAHFFDPLATALTTHRRKRVNLPAAARLQVRITLGTIRLRPDEIAESRAGDILILPEIGTLALIQATCIDRRNRRLPLRAWLEKRVARLVRYEGETMMEEQMNTTMNTMTNAAHDSVLTMAGVAVPVTAVIGEIELPLRDFDALQTGYVFELPAEVESVIIRLYTGSRCVGTGRLVTIGDRLGVRLLEWGGTSDGKPA